MCCVNMESICSRCQIRTRIWFSESQLKFVGREDACQVLSLFPGMWMTKLDNLQAIRTSVRPGRLREDRARWLAALPSRRAPGMEAVSPIGCFGVFITKSSACVQPVQRRCRWLRTLCSATTTVLYPGSAASTNRNTLYLSGNYFRVFFAHHCPSRRRLSQCRSIDAKGEGGSPNCPTDASSGSGSREPGLFSSVVFSRSEQRQLPTASERHLGCSAWTPFGSSCRCGGTEA